MTTDPKKFEELFELLGVLREGCITKEQFARLDQLLASDGEALDYYLDYVQLCTELQKYAIANESDEPKADNLLAEAIERDIQRREEREAQEARRAAEIKKEEVRQYAEKKFEEFKEEERRRQEKLAYKQYRAERRRNILTVGLLAACLLLVFGLWIHNKLTSGPVAPPIVATLIESQRAQWDDPQLVVKPGTQLTASPMKLRRGLVKIAFDDGAEVILQAPCNVILENTNQMYLQSGNLAAVVPERAWGFTVRTSGATIVDYGTEFGVTAYATGETEAHVFKGEVDLRSGSDIKVYRQSQRLKSGEANRVDRTGKISQNKFKANRQRFIRGITEEESFGRPGERLDLADVVADGNGFGTGSRKGAIDLLTGKVISDFIAEEKIGRNQFMPVNEAPFVDGVFVPDGGLGPVMVSSMGHKFISCPDTNGKAGSDICNSLNIAWENKSLWASKTLVDFILNGKQYYQDTKQPAIFLHANAGITFDLDAICSAMPGVKVVKFKSICGICESAMTKGSIKNPEADFWVLVDGEVRFSARGVKPQKGGVVVDVSLGNQDRFLTLVTTDGSQNNTTDWGIFVEPRLELDNIKEVAN